MRISLSVLLIGLTILSSSLVSGQSLPDNIDISNSENGIVPLPASVSAPWHNAGLVKYTKIMAPNGQAIHFVSQNLVTDEQVIRSREILRMYLSAVPGTEYGADKSSVANQMGNNEAVLLLLNGSDSDNSPELPGQPLYQNEIAVEGHPWYINNDYENHRDAAFEEILHLMHDYGIGIDGPGGTPGALPLYQAEIRVAQQNASANNYQFWPLMVDPGVQDWYNELAAENSLSQEYLASVIDSYYGLWGAWSESSQHGMWGLYIAKTRDEIRTEDPQGWAILPKYFSPYLTYMARIDAGFAGTFSLAFEASAPYTHKSQYLLNARLLGNNDSNLTGNDQDNRLQGNNGQNRLSGGDGSDTAVFRGSFSDYTVSTSGAITTVFDNTPSRDNIDTLDGIEWLQFSDRLVNVSSVTAVDDRPEASLVRLSLAVFPNPVRADTQISFELPHSQLVDVSIYDLAGRKVRHLIRGTGIQGLNKVSWDGRSENGVGVASGTYFARIQAGKISVSRKLLIIDR